MRKIYSEDDWKAEVEVLEDNSDEEWERYKLKVIRTITESRMCIQMMVPYLLVIREKAVFLVYENLEIKSNSLERRCWMKISIGVSKKVGRWEYHTVDMDELPYIDPRGEKHTVVVTVQEQKDRYSKQEADIYKLKLHESVWSNDCQKTIVRVPGGWIYQDYDIEKDLQIPGGVFVPYDNDMAL